MSKNLLQPKSVYITNIYDVYNSLLTDKQRLYFEQYYFYDVTLQEIADACDISKNAVSDSIIKTTKILIDYENNLKILSKQESVVALVDKFKDNRMSKDEFLKKLENFY
ncbi:MAG: YlxM family DNA-binding protein [Mycoplasma sp.]